MAAGIYYYDIWGDSMDFQPITLRKVLQINVLYGVHYLELAKNYTEPGASHSFWEMVYIDKGECQVTVEQEHFTATRGEVFFYAPGQHHLLKGNGESAANILVVSFQCKSKLMDQMVGKRLRPTSSQVALLKDVLRESRLSFSSALDDPFNNTLERREDPYLGSEQMIGCYMTEFLVSTLRRMQAPRLMDKKIGSEPMLDAIVAYMEEHISAKLSMDLLAEVFHVSPSYIKRLFAQYKQIGAMSFFSGMKIDRAKNLLRERELNVSQIAEVLGYDNSYYFCNRFKKATGMSPLEYRRSVNSHSDRALNKE